MRYAPVPSAAVSDRIAASRRKKAVPQPAAQDEMRRMLRTQPITAAGELCQSGGNTLLNLAGSQSFYPKVVQLLAGSELRPQPARLFATAGPGLNGITRISIFGENLRVRTTLVRKAMQPLIKLAFLRRYLAAQFGNHLSVKVP